MTNAESYLQEALEKRDNGKLNDWEKGFVTSFEGYTKKDLRGLSSKQFKMLRNIAND